MMDFGDMSDAAHKILIPTETQELLHSFAAVSGAVWLSGPVVARFASSKIVAAPNEGVLWVPRWEVSWERTIKRTCPDVVFEIDEFGK